VSSTAPSPSVSLSTPISGLAQNALTTFHDENDIQNQKPYFPPKTSTPKSARLSRGSSYESHNSRSRAPSSTSSSSAATGATGGTGGSLSSRLAQRARARTPSSSASSSSQIGHTGQLNSPHLKKIPNHHSTGGVMTPTFRKPAQRRPRTAATTGKKSKKSGKITNQARISYSSTGQFTTPPPVKRGSNRRHSTTVRDRSSKGDVLAGNGKGNETPNTERRRLSAMRSRLLHDRSDDRSPGGALSLSLSLALSFSQCACVSVCLRTYLSLSGLSVYPYLRRSPIKMYFCVFVGIFSAKTMVSIH